MHQPPPDSTPLDLSVAIVCKSNEPTITRTLQSVQGLASEIVAVDSGSTDGTIDILRSFGARVEHSPWLGHVRTKQLALDHCTRTWVLALDSDESLEPALQSAIRSALTTPTPHTHGYQLNRKVFYNGRFLNYAWQPELRLRLVRKGAAKWAGIDPHDGMVMANGTQPARLTGDIRHDSFNTFEEQLRKQVTYARLGAAELVARGHRGSPLRLVTSPIGALAKQLILKQAWRDGWPGWLAAGSAAAQAMMKHMLIIEQARKQNMH